MTSPWPCPQRFLQDPYSTTFSSFSRVTNFFRGALQPHPEGSAPNLHPAPDDEPEPGFEVISCVSVGGTPYFWLSPRVCDCISQGPSVLPRKVGIVVVPPSSGSMSDPRKCSQPVLLAPGIGGSFQIWGDTVSDPGKELLPTLNVNSVELRRTEVTSRWLGLGRAVGSPTDRAHLPRVRPQVELGARPDVEREPPVTEEEWARHVGPEGRMQQVPELKARIFSGVRRGACGGGGPGRAGGQRGPL